MSHTVPRVEIRELAVRDAYAVDLVPHGDARGRFTEWYRADVLGGALGFPLTLAQANHSVSARGVLRGVHFALVPPGQAKYVYCPAGRVLDVVVDVRVGSPTLGHHVAVELRGRNHKIIWVPPGFAHGTFALEEDSIVLYECTAEHGPGREGGIRWNDPALAIAWPAMPTIVSEKDRVAPTLAEWLADPRAQHFRYV